MQHSRIRTAVLVTLSLLATSVAAQQQGDAPAPAPAAQQPAAPGDQAPQPPSGPTFRGGINYVRVDAIVTDRKQQPVTDLQASDFEVLEDGKPQTVETFRLVRVDGNPKPGDGPPRQIRTRNDEEMEAARDDVRIFVIFLDDYHVRATNAMSVREPLTRFINNQLRPNDLVAIMYPLTPVSALSFTRNLDSVMAAVQRFEGRKYNYQPRNEIEQRYTNQRLSAEAVEQIRNDVVMGALQGLSVRLGGLREGRKSVIVVSEGLTIQLPPQMRQPDATGPNRILSGAGAVANSPREQTQEWFNAASLESRMRDVYDAANRNNTSFYTLDPRGLAVGEYDINDGGFNGQPDFATDRRSLQLTQDTLRNLADQTDGRAIVNRNTLLEGLAQVTQDASFYYLLGYNSSQAPNDGKFHEIKVRVKRSGVDVRARKGYWAATVDDLAKIAKPAVEVARPVQQALASIATSVQSGKYVRTWLGAQKGEGGKTRMTLIWEPLSTAPGTVRREQPGRVSVLAADSKGDLVFRGRSPDAALASTGAPQSPSAAAATTPQRIVFDAPPGKLELRLTVEGAGGVGTLDQEVRTVDVPDLTAPQATISTPRVHRARTARDVQAAIADGNAVPVAAREFSRTERLLIRFDVYGAGTDVPTPTAVMLNRAGQKIADVPIAASAAGGTHHIDLGLNTTPPGEYLIEISVDGASGAAKELVAFRVTS